MTPETWELIRNLIEMISVFAIPVFSWVIYTLVQQGKQIIVLEQKVNESLNQRLQRVEKRIGNVEEKIDEIAENVVECRMITSENKNAYEKI
ncbi:MAG TPA: hypothetical protein DHV30_11885, partial [Balneola sp.]|nr:hypothetical protein [Balneola sp.]